jgi:hypothetical protein
LSADGARWIRNFYTGMLAKIPNKQMILDGYHLHQKGYPLGSTIGRGRKARRSSWPRFIVICGQAT